MSSASTKGLKLRQVSESLQNKTPVPIEKLGQRIKDIRESLGMTQKQLAKRLKVRQPLISKIEENIETSSIKTVARIIRALNCEFAGVILSDLPLEEIIKKQAVKIAEKILKRTFANMAMEKQSPNKSSYKFQFNRLVKELVSSPGSELWEN